jgi:hypothetical protein
MDLTREFRNNQEFLSIFSERKSTWEIISGTGLSPPAVPDNAVGTVVPEASGTAGRTASSAGMEIRDNLCISRKKIARVE